MVKPQENASHQIAPLLHMPRTPTPRTSRTPTPTRAASDLLFFHENPKPHHAKFYGVLPSVKEGSSPLSQHLLTPRPCYPTPRTKSATPSAGGAAATPPPLIAESTRPPAATPRRSLKRTAPSESLVLTLVESLKSLGATRDESIAVIRMIHKIDPKEVATWSKDKVSSLLMGIRGIAQRQVSLMAALQAHVAAYDRSIRGRPAADGRLTPETTMVVQSHPR